ncbi:unnamed protein product [Pleuronectes platessa]|uniref:Uncharacterized protein n=1 Tax=Pleuronectes platessa TaxID=8262 RepID=A0A9N7Z691_PLEPL|nr:unnamed protein product [Pleuronectes platessa]
MFSCAAGFSGVNLSIRRRDGTRTSSSKQRANKLLHQNCVFPTREAPGGSLRSGEDSGSTARQGPNERLPLHGSTASASPRVLRTRSSLPHLEGFTSSSRLES